MSIVTRYLKTPHTYRESCPSPENPTSLDRECPACRILLEIEDMEVEISELMLALRLSGIERRLKNWVHE